MPLEDELREALEHARREIRLQDLGPVVEEVGSTSTRRASEAAAAGASFDVQVNICDHLHIFS